MNIIKQITKTVALLLAFCVSGVAMAQDCKAGLDKYNAEDYDGALKEWLPLAEQGDVKAQVGVAHVYEVIGGDDSPERFKWYLKAAEQGDASALYRLSELYHWGWGVEENYGEARRLWHLAAERGSIEAQYELARSYEIGREEFNIEEDQAEAFKWYLRAAEQGHFYAMLDVIYRYWSGEGVEVNEAEAFKWYREVSQKYPARENEFMDSEVIQELKEKLGKVGTQ